MGTKFKDFFLVIKMKRHQFSIEKCKSVLKFKGTLFFLLYFLPEAPDLNSRIDGKSSNLSADIQFEERLQAVKRCFFFHVYCWNSPMPWPKELRPKQCY